MNYSSSQGHFDFIYTTAGPGAVPGSDTALDVKLYHQQQVIGATQAGNGVPDYVEKLALLMEYAYGRFINFGFPGLQNPIKVTIQAPSGGGLSNPMGGCIYLPNNLDDRMMDSMPIHELFHFFQYLISPRVWLGSGLWKEGTAELAPDLISDYANLWHDRFNEYSNLPYLSLNSGRCQYVSAGLWRYLVDQLTRMKSPLDEPAVGIDVLLKCWQIAAGKQTNNMELLTEVMDDIAPASVHFARLGGPSSNETIFGNWLIANTVKDLKSPVPDTRFDYLEDEEDPPLNPIMRTKVPSQGSLPSTVSVAAWAESYFEIDLQAITGPVLLSCLATRDDGQPGASDHLLQVVLVDTQDNIVDIIRTKAASYARVFGNPYTQNGQAIQLKTIYLILAGLTTNTKFEPVLQTNPAAVDLMITTWNCDPGREYQKDWHNYAWDYTSPDIWLDSGELSRPLPNSLRLNVRVRNKGNAVARKVRVKVSVQVAPRLLRPIEIQQRLEILELRPQEIASIAAGGEALVSMDVMIPSQPGTGTGKRNVTLLIRAETICAADKSLDNNVGLARFPYTITV